MQTVQGVVKRKELISELKKTIGLVHLKSVDCPGWALFECMLAGVPVVVGEFCISRMRAENLLIPGETCYSFGIPPSEPLGRGNVAYAACYTDIAQSLGKLQDPEINKRIGLAGKEKLLESMWNPERGGESFRQFMACNY